MLLLTSKNVLSLIINSEKISRRSSFQEPLTGSLVKLLLLRSLMTVMMLTLTTKMMMMTRMRKKRIPMTKKKKVKVVNQDHNRISLNARISNSPTMIKKKLIRIARLSDYLGMSGKVQHLLQ